MTNATNPMSALPPGLPRSGGAPPARLGFGGRLFIGAFSLRVAIALWVSLGGGRAVEPDSGDYLALASSLRSHGSFARDAVGAVPDIKRTPGYPVLLVLTGASEERPLLILIVQAALGAGTCVIAWRTAQALGLPETAGRGAGILLAVDPLSVVYAALVLSETLFATLVAGWLLATALAARSPASPASWRALAVSVIAAGLATLTRPLALFLYIPTVWLLGIAWRRGALHAAGAVGILVIGSVPLAGWLVRNRIVSGGFVLTTIGATNLLDYRAAGALAADEGRPYLEVREQLRREHGDDDPTRSAPEARALADRKTELGLAILKAHPTAAAKQSATALVVILAPPGAGAVLKATGIHEGGTGLYSAVSSFDGDAIDAAVERLEGKLLPVVVVTIGCSLFALALWAGVAAGLVRAARTPGERRRALALAGLIALLVLPGAGPEAEPRFRLPAMIALALLAGSGMTALRNRLRRPSPPSEGAS